jgi:UrcA family protein
MTQIDVRTHARSARTDRFVVMAIIAAASFTVVAPRAAAADTPEIIVEAAAPVKQTTIGHSATGTATELLSVRYRVQLAGLDLTRHADVEKLQQQIRDAAAKGCKQIQSEYPLRPMTDEKTCISSATDSAMQSARVAIADAEKHSAR